MSQEVARGIFGLVEKFSPQQIVIENTVAGRNRDSQRQLEFIHYALLDLINKSLAESRPEVYYVSPGIWRNKLQIKLTAEDKQDNKILRRGTKEQKRLLKDKKNLRGIISKKHLAIRYVHNKYNINIKVKQDDVAVAICLGDAFLLNCKVDQGE